VAALPGQPRVGYAWAMRLSFTKMHGAGNDFIVFDRPAGMAMPSAAQWRALADRHCGIGFDQAIVFEPARSPDTVAFYRVFNADGGEVEQCGNGARCAVRLLQLQGRASGEVSLGSVAGTVHGRIAQGGAISVNMGPPRLDPAALPFVAPAEAMSYPIDIEGHGYEIGAVSMGNPHAVLRVTDVESAPVEAIGRALQLHPRFPKRVNVGFMQILEAGRIRLRVYERGVGETLACGTGICAAVVVGRVQGLLAADVEVRVPGGQLGVHWDGGDAPVWLSGPAVIAYTGQVEL
jgi:diaminopimelate epimerase